MKPGFACLNLQGLLNLTTALLLIAQQTLLLSAQAEVTTQRLLNTEELTFVGLTAARLTPLHRSTPDLGSVCISFRASAPAISDYPGNRRIRQSDYPR
jgi:hypothetical protein